MKPLPDDPMRRHNRFIAAFCDDLFDMVVSGAKGTPRADAVMEVARQVDQESTGSAGESNKPPAVNQ